MYFLWIVMFYFALSSFELGICLFLSYSVNQKLLQMPKLSKINEFQNVSLSTEVLVLLFGYNRFRKESLNADFSTS